MSFGRASGSVTALALLAVAGCGSGDGEPAASPGGPEPIAVVASTNVYGSIVEAVGGDRVAVTSLIDDPSADPHSYESTPADAAAVARARIMVENGGGYDDFMSRIAQ